MHLLDRLRAGMGKPLSRPTTRRDPHEHSSNLAKASKTIGMDVEWSHLWHVCLLD